MASAAARPRWPRRLGVHAVKAELGAMLVAAGLGPPPEHALISLLVLNGLRVSEAIGADIEQLGLERGYRTLTITRNGGKVVTIPLAPRTARAIDLATGERTGGPAFLAAGERGSSEPLTWAAANQGPRAARGPSTPPRPGSLSQTYLTGGGPALHERQIADIGYVLRPGHDGGGVLRCAGRRRCTRPRPCHQRR